MATLRFSRKAEKDILDIGAYTLQVWGEAQAIRYLDDLQTSCRMLTDNPGMGRSCYEVRSALRRLEHNRHVIFYRKIAEGILVCRILHQRMMPEKHSIDIEDDRPE